MVWKAARKVVMEVRASSSEPKEMVQVESELETRAYCGWVRWASWVGWQPTMTNRLTDEGGAKWQMRFGLVALSSESTLVDVLM